MPSIQIETQSGWMGDPAPFVAAAGEAVAQALNMPAWSGPIRVVEHQPSHFPSMEGSSPRRTCVQVVMMSGRSREMKRKIYQGMVERFARLGVPGMELSITLLETDADNWGIRGGQMASDLGIGVKAPA